MGTGLRQKVGASSAGAGGVGRGDGLALDWETSQSYMVPLAMMSKGEAWGSEKMTAGRRGTSVTAPKQTIWRTLIQEETLHSVVKDAAGNGAPRDTSGEMTRTILRSGWRGVVVLTARAYKMVTWTWIPIVHCCLGWEMRMENENSVQRVREESWAIVARWDLHRA